MNNNIDVSTTDILALVPDLLSPYSEKFDGDRRIKNIGTAEVCDSGSIIFIEQEGVARGILEMDPALVVTTGALADLMITLHGGDKGMNIAITANPKLAMALVRAELDAYDSSDSEWPALHPAAVIHESAELADDVRIGPGVVVGEKVSIGAGTIIRSNAVIEHDAVIGSQCVIHSGVNIGYGCALGNRVIVKANAVIGMEGFGFVPDDNKHFHRMPQTGRVVVGDDAVIGALCNIDRATLGDTVVGCGAKLDALVHVAHNVEIGEHSIITAQCAIAGSAKIGKHVIMSGQTGVLDHKHIADDTIFVHRAGVIHDIEEPGMYGGLPATPWKEHVRNLGLSRRLDKLEKRLKKLEQSKD